MEIVVTGRHTQIKQRFRDVVENKMNRVTAIAPDAERVQIVVTHEGNPRQADTAKRVEITVIAGRTVVRAEASSTDEYSALSAAGGQEAGMKDNEREQARLQREMQKLVQDRNNLNASTGDEDYQRLAVIKSRELQLQQELDKLEAQSAPPLTVAHLARVIELWTKIPASQIQEAEYERLAQLENRLKEHIIGQDDAVKAVAAAVRRGRVGIASKRKPV